MITRSIAALLLLLAAPTLAGESGWRAIDGDTIHDLLTAERVRIVGLDAPETRQARCATERALGERADPAAAVVRVSGAGLAPDPARIYRGVATTPRETKQMATTMEAQFGALSYFVFHLMVRDCMAQDNPIAAAEAIRQQARNDVAGMLGKADRAGIAGRSSGPAEAIELFADEVAATVRERIAARGRPAG